MSCEVEGTASYNLFRYLNVSSIICSHYTAGEKGVKGNSMRCVDRDRITNHVNGTRPQSNFRGRSQQRNGKSSDLLTAILTCNKASRTQALSLKTGVSIWMSI